MNNQSWIPAHQREWIAPKSSLLMITLVCLIVATQISQAQELAFTSARRLLEMEQPSNAIQSVKEIIKTQPGSSPAYYYLGYLQLSTGDVALADQSFDKGIGVNGEDPLNYAGKGHVQLLKRNSTEAKKLLDKALSLSKKNVAGQQAVARAYLEVGQSAAEMVMLLEKIKKQDKTNVETFFLLGDARVIQKKAGPAISDYESAAQYDPANARSHYKIGLIYLQNKELTMAEESFRKAISVDSSYTPAFKELGELYYARKDGPSAVKYYKRYLSLTETPGRGQQRYAFFLLMAKDYAGANEVFHSLAKSPEVTTLTLRYYSMSLFEAGNYPLCSTYYEQYFSKTNGVGADAADYEYYGKALLKLNRDSLAQVSIQKSLALNPDQPALMLLQAETYFKMKKYPETLQSYRRLEKAGGRLLAQDYYAIGLSNYFNRQYAAADSSFHKLIELQPEMAVGYLWEARTKSNLDPESELGLAKPYYDKVIEKTRMTPDKSRKDLIEAYSYLGYYHYVKKEFKVSKSYWAKVLELDPADVKAREAVRQIK